MRVQRQTVTAVFGALSVAVLMALTALFFFRPNAVRAYPPAPPARIVSFPTDPIPLGRGVFGSFGTLHTRPWQEGPIATVGPWQEIGKARGELSVPADTMLMLNLDSNNNTSLSALSRLDPFDLQVLSVPGQNRITHRAMPSIGHLAGLRILHLGGAQITDDSLVHLSRLAFLEHLDLQNCPISDKAIPHLSKLRSLRSLWLFRTRMTKQGISRLQSALNECEISH